MKSLEDLIRRIPEIARNKCKKIADSISNKTMTNINRAMNYLSDWIDDPRIYQVSSSNSKEITIEINVIGKQVAFLEFGTGVKNEPYSIGLNSKEYLPHIAHSKSIQHGTYGDGKGSQDHWAFYPKYEGNVSTVNGDKIYDYRVYHRKRDGGVSIYQLAKPVIITKGIAPQRMIYNAIRDTKREVSKK